MCTNIIEKVSLSGSAKGAKGWMAVDLARVSLDHPAHADLEYALNIDFVNAAAGGVDRVAVELSPESARQLVQTILATLDTGHPAHG
jgi:hypothetical protein